MNVQSGTSQANPGFTSKTIPPIRQYSPNSRTRHSLRARYPDIGPDEIECGESLIKIPEPGQQYESRQDEKMLITQRESNLLRDIEQIRRLKENNERILKARIQSLEEKLKKQLPEFSFAEDTSKIHVLQSQVTQLSGANRRLREENELMKGQLLEQSLIEKNIILELNMYRDSVRVLQAEVEEQRKKYGEIVEETRKNLEKMEGAVMSIKRLQEEMEGMERKHGEEMKCKTQEILELNRVVEIQQREKKDAEQQFCSKLSQLQNSVKETQRQLKQKDQSSSSLRMESAQVVWELGQQIKALQKSNSCLRISLMNFCDFKAKEQKWTEARGKRVKKMESLPTTHDGEAGQDEAVLGQEEALDQEGVV